jgi:hypothetical protein
MTYSYYQTSIRIFGPGPTRTPIEPVVNGVGGAPAAAYVRHPPELVEIAEAAEIGKPLLPYS